MKIKREFPAFAPWDAQGMAAHLEAMELRGWQLRGTDWLGRWEYLPTAPARVRYAVTYAPSRKNWRLMPTEAELDLEDICFDAGWRKIAAISRYHIYRNPVPDCTDLETEELTRLNTLHRCYWRDLALNAASFGLLSLLLVWSLWSLYQTEPHVLLAMPLAPFVLLYPLWLLTECILPPLLYRSWLRRARQAAETGAPTPEVTGWKPYHRWSHLLGICLILLIVVGGEFRILAAFGVVYAIFSLLRHRLSKQTDDPEDTERRYQNLLFWLVIALIVLNIYIQNADRPDVSDTHPLTMAHFSTDPSVATSDDLERIDGPFATYHRYWASDDPAGRHIFCTIFDRRVPVLEEACDAWFYDYFCGGTSQDITPGDATVWGAEEVWRAGDLWLLRWEDRTVTLFTSWPMTDEDIAIAARQLAP